MADHARQRALHVLRHEELMLATYLDWVSELKWPSTLIIVLLIGSQLLKRR